MADRAALLAKARAGDQNAMGLLIMPAERRAMALLTGRLGFGQEDAEEVWSDTMLAAIQKFASFEGRNDAAVETWVVGIAHHKGIDRLRADKSRREGRARDQQEARTEEPEPEVKPPEATPERERAFAKLAARPRQALRLREWGISLPDLGWLLAVGQADVTRYLNTARKALLREKKA